MAVLSIPDLNKTITDVAEIRAFLILEVSILINGTATLFLMTLQLRKKY